jgi:chemotaxis protein MotB
VAAGEEEARMMRRRWWWLAGAALVGAGCAHSEDEWQAQLRTIGDLKTKLDAEQAQAKKARVDLDESTAKNEQLKQQLRAAGVDVANLDAHLEAQARASEEYRRRGEQLDAAKRRLELLRSKLAPLSAQGLTVTVRNNRLSIHLPGDALFDAGRETLKRDGREMLLKLAALLREDPSLSARSYQVAGHVDEVPAGGRFKDTVGFSLMRAREVLALLVQPAAKGGGGFDPARWSAAGYGDADPLKPNDSPEGKQANRRCEIVVQPAVEEMLDIRALAP